MDIDDLVIGLWYVIVMTMIVSAFCLVVAECTSLLPDSMLFVKLTCISGLLSVGILSIRYFSLVISDWFGKGV